MYTIKPLYFHIYWTRCSVFKSKFSLPATSLRERIIQATLFEFCSIDATNRHLCIYHLPAAYLLLYCSSPESFTINGVMRCDEI